MDFLGLPSVRCREEAWKRLVLSCLSSSSSVGNSANFQLVLSKLKYYKNPESSNNIITKTEFHVLSAIFENASNFNSIEQTEAIIPILCDYLIALPNCSFKAYTSSLDDDLTPWTKLAKQLTLALITMSRPYNKFNALLNSTFIKFIENLDSSSLYYQFSLYGFVYALTLRPEVVNESMFLSILSVFNPEFYDLIETTVLQIEAKDEDLLYRISDLGFEYSSIFFIDLIEKFQIEFLKSIIHAEKNLSLLDHLFLSESISVTILDEYSDVLQILLKSQYTIENYLNSSNDRITKSSLYRRKTCSKIQAHTLTIYAFNNKISNLDFTFLNNKISAYLSLFLKSIDESSPIALEMITSNLLLNSFGSGAILSESNQVAGLNIVKHFPIIVQTIVMPKEYVKKLTVAVQYCLKSLSKDDTISLIYTLINILGDSSNNTKSRSNTVTSSQSVSASSIIDTYLVERNDLIPQNIVTAVVEITKASNDESIITLVTTLLYQKIKPKSDELNAVLLDGLTEFVDNMNKKDFSALLKYYYDVSESSTFNTLNIQTWIKFSKAIAKTTNEELYNAYLHGLLFQIISKGDIDDLEHHRPNQSVTESAKEIQLFLKPLANLLPSLDEPPRIPKDKEIVRRFQDAWFNLSVHGFAYNSPLYQHCLPELLRISHSSPVLASESTWNRSETSIEMNTILRRGTSKTTERIHKDVLKNIISMKSTIDTDSKISRPGMMFLSCTLMLEMLRIQTGTCSKVLEYISDPSVIIAKLHTHVSSIAVYTTNCFAKMLLKNLPGNFVTIKKVTTQLKNLFILCCHRNPDLQNTAFKCADIIVNQIPSALCYDESAFALLDVLGLIFQSIIDADTNEYEPLTKFKSRVTDIDLLLSDSYSWRKETLDTFTNYATRWFLITLKLCDGNMKSVLRNYVTKADASHRTINYGVSFALDMASKILSNDREFYQLSGIKAKQINTTAGFLSQTPWNTGARLLENGFGDIATILSRLDEKIEKFIVKFHKSPLEDYHHEFSTLLDDITRVIIMIPVKSEQYCMRVVELPFMLFDSFAIEHSINNWLSIMNQRSDLAVCLLSFILNYFEQSIIKKQGLFSRKHDLTNPEYNLMEYLPTNKLVIEHNANKTSTSFKPHLLLIRFLKAHFHATLYQSDDVLNMFAQTVLISLEGLKSASLHPFSRLARFELVYFGCDILRFLYSLESIFTQKIINALLDGALSWFTRDIITPFGNNKLKIKADFEILMAVAIYFGSSSFIDLDSENKKHILLLFLDDEIKGLSSWLNPLGGSLNTTRTYAKVDLSPKIIRECYSIDGKLAVQLVSRLCKKNTNSQVVNELTSCILKNPFAVAELSKAVEYIEKRQIPAIVAWASASPIFAIKKFFDKSPYFVQYSMRSIESFDVHLTFFYVPQIVQSMRHDNLGYIRRFILETANVSQLFAHQIIWNMAANSFKDEDSTIPDSIKPILDEIRESMIRTFSDADRQYFDKEFSFFEEVTGISGKLKPYIKKSKPEKKAKIDEEMSKIKVEEGVYLPSNPDGIVVDIDRKSGKPLQSHAKAPFMATFFIKKKIERLGKDSKNDIKSENGFEIVKTSAIFKVGDDCRQDVLALQLISMFRTIWMTAGVDVYVFPYRVTATAPGCGIIDVLPRSISRDMLGREAVNGLYEYFISQFGPETSPEFQRARINFVKSLAAYSIITYLLAIKDRHNGNIMYDQDGHILHIDFGFCFDIVPGGVKFEQSPFKLTREMVRVMGGSQNTQAYKWFEELCVKCFLACRIHMDALIGLVTPMLESGLPCFKAATIKHLEERFVPNKTDQEATVYVRNLIRKSFESFATKGYDEFQRITNGIPY